MKDKIVCGRCEEEMEEVVLHGYEFEEGITLDNVKAMRCRSGHITFTEKQALAMERRTENIRKRMFRFERSVSKSARSLVIRIPSDLAGYLGIDEKSRVVLIPLNKKKFLVEIA